MGTVEGDERVIERSVCCMERKWKKKKRKRKKKKRKEANEWPVKGVRILVRCLVEGSGVGGVTRVAP